MKNQFKVITKMTNKKTDSFSEKRQAERATAPAGSTALLRNALGSLDGAYISDISESGLLVRDYPNKGNLPVDSSINDIFVYIPPYDQSDDCAISLLLHNCKIVRSYFDQTSQSTCYGIEFLHKSNYVTEKIESLVQIHNSDDSPPES